MTEIVVVEATDAMTHVAVRGRLDAMGVGQVEAELGKQTLARHKPAIVDLSAVDLLASVGIGMLVKLARWMHSNELMLVVVAVGINKENLERLKVDSIFPVVATPEEAVRTLEAVE